MTSQAEQGVPWWLLPRLPETDMPEKLVCGPSEAPLAPMLCWLPVWKLFLRTVSVKALQRSGFSPPHKITFKGAAAHGSCPELQGKCVERVPVQNLLITQGPIMGPLPNPRPTTFLRLIQEQHKHSDVQLSNFAHLSQVFRSAAKTSALKCGSGSRGPRDSVCALQASLPSSFHPSHNSQVPFRSHMHLLL